LPPPWFQEHHFENHCEAQMKIIFLRVITAGSLVSLVWLAGCQTSDAPKSAAGSGAFATGHYRSLFAENGHSGKEIRNKVDSAFAQLFHGNPGSQAIYFSAGANSNGPLAYITDIKHNDVRTEGLSYGMIICVQLNKQAEFNALWNWSLNYLYHSDPTDPGYGFFAWQARTSGARMS
jgi:oligosaccharide reducing-end xylanase